MKAEKWPPVSATALFNTVPNDWNFHTFTDSSICAVDICSAIA